MDARRMRRILGPSIPAPIWPDGVVLRLFEAEDAAAIHALLCLAYAKGGGNVGPLAEWWNALAMDDEYDPTLCFAAWAQGSVIGAMQCWTSAFVKDLVVHPGWRRHGIGKALLLTAFHTFRDRGAVSVDLKVQSDNHGAIMFYESLGMVGAD